MDTKRKCPTEEFVILETYMFVYVALTVLKGKHITEIDLLLFTAMSYTI